MGIVYKARQTSMKRIVALKMLGSYAAAFPGIADRIQIEAEAAGSLRHPHIVTIHDVGEHEGRPFFSMEFIEGAGLDKFIGPEGFRPATPTVEKSSLREHQSATIRLMGKVVRAVDYAHRRGVLHRDIKPANIIIDSAGEPHLTDFGLAKVMGRASVSATASGSILGTPAYMAPEQASGDSKNASTAADIYSLGAVLYEMLLCQPPFLGTTPLETLRSVIETEPKHPSSFGRGVDRDLATVCLKCLEKDPQRRYTSASALADDLDRWLDGKPIEARPVRPAERFWRWCRRKPALVALLAVVLLAAMVIGFMSYRLWEQNNERSIVELRGQKDRLADRIDKEWREAGRVSISISAEDISSLSGNTIPFEGDESVLNLGLNGGARMESTPHYTILDVFAPFANTLRTNIALRPVAVNPPDDALGGNTPRRVAFKLLLYTTVSNSVEGFVRGETDVMQTSPMAYLSIRDRGVPVTLLAQQLHQSNSYVRGAIFTRTGSGIEKLSDLKGQTFAFSTSDPALSPHFAKSELFRAGVYARDLASWTNARPGRPLQLVREGSFSAGSAKYGDVERLIQAGAPIKIIHEFRAPSQVWIAAAKADSGSVEAFRTSLLLMRDLDMLSAIDVDLTGFAPASLSDFDPIKEVLEQARLFDGPELSAK